MAKPIRNSALGLVYLVETVTRLRQLSSISGRIPAIGTDAIKISGNSMPNQDFVRWKVRRNRQSAQVQQVYHPSWIQNNKWQCSFRINRIDCTALLLSNGPLLACRMARYEYVFHMHTTHCMNDGWNTCFQFHWCDFLRRLLSLLALIRSCGIFFSFSYCLRLQIICSLFNKSKCNKQFIHISTSGPRANMRWMALWSGRYKFSGASHCGRMITRRNGRKSMWDFA